MHALRTATALLLSAVWANAKATEKGSFTSYDVEIPSSAIRASDWDSLHAGGDLFPDLGLVNKYGGWVMEMDGAIVLAVDDAFIQDVTEINKPTEDEEECEEIDEEDAEGKLVKRCSHPRCFVSAICRSYTNCHVCRIYNYTTGAGTCI